MTRAARRSRDYQSPLRVAQAKETRARIVRALADQLLRPPRADFSIPEAAAAAGVSVRTIYHYFPSQESQIAAVADWLNAQLAADVAPPESAAGIPAMLAALYAQFFANERIGRAQLAPGITSRIRSRRRTARVNRIRQLVEEAAAAPKAERTKLISAVVAHLAGAQAAIALMDELGLSKDEALAATSGAIEILVRAVAATSSSAE